MRGAPRKTVSGQFRSRMMQTELGQFNRLERRPGRHEATRRRLTPNRQSPGPGKHDGLNVRMLRAERAAPASDQCTGMTHGARTCEGRYGRDNIPALDGRSRMRKYDPLHVIAPCGNAARPTAASTGYRPSDHIATARRVLGAWLVCFGIVVISLGLPTLWHDASHRLQNGEAHLVAHRPSHTAPVQ